VTASLAVPDMPSSFVDRPVHRAALVAVLTGHTAAAVVAVSAVAVAVVVGQGVEVEVYYSCLCCYGSVDNAHHATAVVAGCDSHHWMNPSHLCPLHSHS